MAFRMSFVIYSKLFATFLFFFSRCLPEIVTVLALHEHLKMTDEWLFRLAHEFNSLVSKPFKIQWSTRKPNKICWNMQFHTPECAMFMYVNVEKYYWNTSFINVKYISLNVPVLCLNIDFMVWWLENWLRLPLLQEKKIFCKSKKQRTIIFKRVQNKNLKLKRHFTSCEI